LHADLAPLHAVHVLALYEGPRARIRAGRAVGRRRRRLRRAVRRIGAQRGRRGARTARGRARRGHPDLALVPGRGASSGAAVAAAAHRPHAGLHIVGRVVVELGAVLRLGRPPAFGLAAGREVAIPQRAGGEAGTAVGSEEVLQLAPVQAEQLAWTARTLPGCTSAPMKRSITTESKGGGGPCAPL